MDKKTKRRVRGVAIFIVFLALGVTIFQFTRSLGKGTGGIDLKPHQRDFNKQRWYNKASFEISSQNVQASLIKMKSMVDGSKDGFQKRETKPNYGVYVFTSAKKDLERLRTQLSEIGTIGSEVETVDTSLVNTNYENEQSNLASYEKDLSELDKIRVPSDQELRRKESLRAQIKATQQKIEDLQRSDSYLVYVSIVPSKQGASLTSSISKFVTQFFLYLVFCFVGVVLIYYGTKLLMYLLALMGVKGLGMSGVGGSYQYGGYSGYASKYSGRYNYGRGKRKVKRVYKDTESTPKEEE